MVQIVKLLKYVYEVLLPLQYSAVQRIFFSGNRKVFEKLRLFLLFKSNSYHLKPLSYILLHFNSILGVQ